jgi:hypothetical protein
VKQHKEKVRRVDESEVNEEQFFIAWLLPEANFQYLR